MMVDGVFYDDGSAASGGSCGVVGMVNCIMGNSQIALVREVGFGYESDVNVATGKKCLQLVHMM
jgi:hypothetical protein